MKWFKHHTDAHDNNKLTKVRMKYGAEGYAIYWYCLELIAGDLGSGSITFELKHDCEVIGFNLKIDSRKVEEIMLYMINLNLFENSQGTITCLKLAKHLDKKTTRNKTIHSIIDAAQSIQNVSPDSNAFVPGQSPDKQEDVPGQSPDCPGLSPLDLDLDLDIKNSHHYRDDFSCFWVKVVDIYKSVDSKPGTKAEAEKQFIKSDPSELDVEIWIDRLSKQAEEKYFLRKKGEFCEPFQHVCRWIKNRGYEYQTSFVKPEERHVC